MKLQRNIIWDKINSKTKIELEQQEFSLFIFFLAAVEQSVKWEGRNCRWNRFSIWTVAFFFYLYISFVKLLSFADSVLFFRQFTFGGVVGGEDDVSIVESISIDFLGLIRLKVK